ncbi:hypothetical protein MLP_28570 [Microlunatus phosphovorus NM-1]|uniref:Uncharacterized protein n=1 Tax=Microlunatus phosphovorus (strain ATCC 700054 / DSM 10555 / JCM 9379 / NBRC 101784 / NCIMB 13414 / VKM Ac-1990 / NM-1) TaxID=1032480 RepID=F5XJH1_MICPN|nr:hypothetical protein [Microlunatus phosphovorus]BAK35871.1 hypothetical protein MLP_28570 [Microlunatus phosphovorus NM-1]
MDQPTYPDPGASTSVEDEAPADEAATRAYLLKRSGREFTPLLRDFVQNPDKSLANRAGPLSEFIRKGDRRGLLALLFAHAIISSGAGEDGWSTTLPLAVWARVFDATKTADRASASSAATKILSRLEQRNLITRQRTGKARNITITLLRPDGSGTSYTRPDGHADRFLKLSHRFWTEGWYEKLDTPALAMLLVSLHEKPGFELASERVPDWYGWSADTAERGIKTLEQLGLVSIRKRIKTAPLAPTGATEVNVYTLVGLLVPPATVPIKSSKKALAPETTANPAPVTPPPGTSTGIWP